MTAKELFDIAHGHEDNGNIGLAIEYYDKIIALWPQAIESYNRLAVIAMLSNNPQQAFDWTTKGLEIQEQHDRSDTVNLLNFRAIALEQLGRHQESRDAFDRAIAIDPNQRDGFFHLVRLLFSAERYTDAEKLLRWMAELDPNWPNTFNSLGFILSVQCRYEDASEAFARAIALRPDYEDALSGLAASLYLARRFRSSEAQYRKVIDYCVAPGTLRSADIIDLESTARLGLALAVLHQGDLVDGFDLYESRWMRDTIRMYEGRPLWQPVGSTTIANSLRGKTLFIWHEQGLGDTIHFIRFIYDLAKCDCKIIVEVQKELYSLLAASIVLPNVRFIRSGEQVPGFDVHMPLMSIPGALGVTYEDLPSFQPYLVAPEHLVEHWHRKLASLSHPGNISKKRIGIVWAGNPSNVLNRRRSMSWRLFEPLVLGYRDRFQFFSLQMGKESVEIHPDVVQLGSSLTDYSVTAAIVANLDLVIAVDTSIVHLAGALGKPVWTMLFYTPDWRWLLDANGVPMHTTPWYASMRLFWQKRPGVWEDVIEDVISALEGV